MEPSALRLLSLLGQPRSPPELAATLAVSKQRVHQLLSTLLESGAVSRSSSGYGRTHLYIKASEQRQLSDADLSGHVARCLSKLPPGVFVSAALVRTEERGWRRELENKGLIRSVKIANSVFVTLTEKGSHHPQYDGSSPKLPGADLTASLGAQRASALAALLQLGQANSTQLAAAAGCQQNQPGSTIGHVIAALKKAGFLVYLPDCRRWKLSETGVLVASAIASNFDRDRTEAEVIKRVAAARRRRATILASRIRGSDFRSAFEHAIAHQLLSGPKTTTDLFNSLKSCILNWRSTHQALQSMRRRALVDRKRTKDAELAMTGPHRAHLWQLTQKGRDALQPYA